MKAPKKKEKDGVDENATSRNEGNRQIVSDDGDGDTTQGTLELTRENLAPPCDDHDINDCKDASNALEDF